MEPAGPAFRQIIEERKPAMKYMIATLMFTAAMIAAQPGYA